MDDPTPASPPAPTPVPTPVSPTLSDPRRARLLLGCGAIVAFLLLVIAVLLFLVWWSQRPIRPVVLSEPERVLVQEKLRGLGEPRAEPAGPREPGPPPSVEGAPPVSDGPAPVELDRPYVPGSKVLRLTEREINGLLHQNTELGDRVRLEFGRDAVNAYLAIPIPQDSPVGGGRMFRARGRFHFSIADGGPPVAILEDLTVFGLSLPKAWLGGLKGENLLADLVGQGPRGPLLRGIKGLRIEPGALILEVED